MEVNTWIEQELQSINLGDSRLNKRMLKVANAILNNPSEAIQTACNNWTDAKAAYRLFDNDQLDEQHILSLHKESTIERLKKSKSNIFLAIQDTTTLNYTHHPKKTGIGKLFQSQGFDSPLQGCLIHNTLLMTEDGEPLGLINQYIYNHKNNKKPNKLRPIIEKESYRWIKSLQNTKELCLSKNVITICDRESDIYEFFVEAQNLNSKVIVRAAKNRMLFKCKHQNPITLWPYLEKQPICAKQALKIPARHNQPERVAHLEIRFANIVLKAPQRSPSAQLKPLPDVLLNAVWIYEPHPPKGIKRLEWMILTNCDVIDSETALQIAKYYRLRWQIECYHRVLKSGCKVEDCRLETFERLKRYLVLKGIVAYRLFWLTHINRTEPNTSCNLVLTEKEWKVLYYIVYKTNKIPKKPPTTQEAIRMIATIGGFLGRKGDGDPGMTTIWRGWSKLSELSQLADVLGGFTCG